jgi:enoyl-CoA hydratase/carnithine racemase
MSYAGEVISAEQACRIGLVTEVVAHDRLLDRAVEVAAMVAEVPSGTMRALKSVYVSGTAGTIGAALAAERAAAASHQPDLALLDQRRAAVTERNRRQVRPMGDSS